MAQNPKFKNISTIQVGDEAAAEIVAFNSANEQLWVLNSPNSTVDCYDFTTPDSPVFLRSYDYSSSGGGATSVSSFGNYIAVAITATVSQDNGKVVVLNASNATVIKEFTVGALPDMLTFTHNGNKIVVANEGEPNDAYDNDPEGSVSIIDVASGIASGVVTQANFQAFNDKKAYLRGIGVRIQDNAGQTVAQDLEPEYVAISEDDLTAFVTLQENNAVAKIDLTTATVVDILPLGYKDFSKGQPTLKTYNLNELSGWPVLGEPAYTNNQGTVMLGGFSGLCYDQISSTEDVSVFWAIPDRGPNDGPVKGVVGAAGNLRPYKLPDYQSRMVKFSLDNTTGEISFNAADQVMLVGKDNTTPISGRGNVEGKDEVPVTYVDAEVDGDYIVDGKYYKELAYDPYGGDFEGIVRDKNGDFWVCDENRPGIYHFSVSGQLQERYVPDGIAAIGGDVEGTYGAETLPANYNNRRSNRGFEGIAYDSDAHVVYAFIQSAMYNPSSAANSSDVIRILGVDCATGYPISEYVYLLERNSYLGTAESAVDKIGDACYVGEGKFIVIERDSKGLGTRGSKKYIYEIDLLGATNILGNATARLDAGTTLELMSADEIVAAGIQPVYKRKVLNLPSIGYLPSDKAEGLALLPNGSMAVINDNDFGLAGAGVTDHTVLGIISFDDDNKIATSDKVDNVNFSHRPVFGAYMPDAISSYAVDGMNYFVVANEGDGREYGDFADETRIKDLTLNTTKFPDASTLQESEELGRLKSISCPTWDDLDGNDEIDNLFIMGGRSFSIYDEFGNLLYDSGSDLIRQTLKYSPASRDVFLNRADDKGVEPEALIIGTIDGRKMAFVGMERLNGIMVYDITDPTDVVFVQYLNDYDFFNEEGNQSPEGFTFIAAEDSPNGEDLFVAGYEVSGTMAVYSKEDVSSNATFMVISDPHYFAPSLLVKDGLAFQTYLAGDRKMLEESNAIMEAMVQKIMDVHPNFLLVPGDLTKDGEKVSHEAMAGFFTQLENAGINVYVAPGNHDINNPHAFLYDGDNQTSVDQVSPVEFKSIYADFGFSEATSSDASSLSYMIEMEDYILLSLDVCHYDDNLTNGSPETAGSIKTETLVWIKNQLSYADTQGKEVIAMMHHGMLEHYDLHATFLSEYMIENWESVSTELADAGLKVVFTGHSHAQDITKKITEKGNVIWDIQTGSTVTYPSPYRIVDVMDNGTMVMDGDRISSVPGVSENFKDYAKNNLATGFPILVKGMLMMPPYSLDESTATYMEPFFTRAYMAHYNGDEPNPGSDDKAFIDGLLTSGDYNSITFGTFLNNLWTDLPTVDWYTTLDLTETHPDVSTAIIQIEDEDKSAKVESIQVYPVPVKDVLNVKMDEKGQFSLYSIKGVMVMQAELVAGVNSFNVNTLSKGMYVYSVSTKEGVYRHLIVIE